MELLEDLIIKYHFLAFKDRTENDLKILKSDEERLLFLNKHLEEKNKIEESYFYTTVDQFVESRRFSWGILATEEALMKLTKETGRLIKLQRNTLKEGLKK